MRHNMSPEEVRVFMTAGTRTGKLATVRKDGSSHVVPIWFVFDGGDIVFTTGENTVKGRNLRRDPRASLCVDDQEPPYSFVQVTGTVSLDDDLTEMLHWGTLLGGRYMGEDRAEEFGRRNAVAGELLARLTPIKIVGIKDIAL